MGSNQIFHCLQFFYLFSMKQNNRILNVIFVQYLCQSFDALGLEKFMLVQIRFQDYIQLRTIKNMR